MVRVRGGFETIVVVDRRIAEEVIPKVFVKLVKQACVDEGVGSSIDTRLALAAAEANSVSSGTFVGLWKAMSW